MKRIAAATFLLAALGMVIPVRQARAQVSVDVSIGGFYDELSPYGEWVDCSYGECWVPRGVAADWQPYSNGEWIYTTYGWTWVSSDPWGGNPYHYGTWAFVDGHGWAWVPGTVWAPAWVTWSYSDSYVGWAPMPPTVTFGSSGYSGTPVVVNETQYVFVPTNRFVGANVTSVRVEPRRNAEIIRQAKPVTRFEVSGGVVRNEAVPVATIQRAMGSKIETREITTAHTTPRSVSSGGAGGSGHLAIVAPPGDVKAARASRKEATPHAVPPEAQRLPQDQAKPQPQAKPQERLQPQAQVQHQEQMKQQQLQPKTQPPPQEQPRAEADPRTHPDRAPAAHPAAPPQGIEKAVPAGGEKGKKEQNKEKKDPPVGEERPK